MARAASRSLSRATPESEEMTCCVCHEDRRYLKQIPCGHNFCDYCLESIIQRHTDQQHFPCPLCRRVIGVPKGGASGFPFYGATVLDLSQSASAQPDEDASECESCGTNLHRTRSFLCVQCNVVLCDNELCHDEHTLEDHNLVVRPRVGAGTPMRDEEAICAKHGHDYDHFCQTCREALCKSCLMGKKQQHARHKVEPLHQSVNTARRHLEEAMSLMEPMFRHLDWVSSRMRKESETFQQEKDRVESHIRARANEAIRMIQGLQGAALESLHRQTGPIEKQLSADSGYVSDMLSGLRRKHSHILSTLSEGSDAAVLRIEMSALDLTRKPNALGKFISNLPMTDHHVRVKHTGDSSTLQASLKKFIGEPRLEHNKRKVPAVNIVSQLPVVSGGYDRANIFRVCSGGEGLLVWVSMSSGRQTFIQLVDMSKMEIITQRRRIMHRETAAFSLVNVDEHSTIAASGLPHFHRLFRDRIVSERSQCRYQISIFAKGKLKACMAEGTHNRSRILPSILCSHISIDDTASMQSRTGQFSIRHDACLISMDMSASGHILAVVDNLYKLHLYRLGATNPYSTFPSSASGVKVTDICFYKLGEREVS